MKILNFISSLILIILITSLFSSCSNNNSIAKFESRKYMPRFKKHEQKNNYKRNSIIKDKSNSLNLSIPLIYSNPTKILFEDFRALNNEIKEIKSKKLDDSNCDEIILNDGTIIQGKVQEIGTDVIKYKKCTNLEGPLYSESKSNIFMIKYSNGTTEVFKNENNTSNSSNIKNEEIEILNNTPKDTFQTTRKSGEPNALIAFIVSLIAFTIGMFAEVFTGMTLGVVGVVLSLISFGRQSKYKDRYKRPGFALPALIISGVTIFLSFIGAILLYG